MKYKLIALLGFSASGKDSIARILEKTQNYKFVVSHTTRPMRSGEQQNIQYHFVSQEKMQQMINNNEFIEYKNYKTIQNNKQTIWHYGIAKNEIDLTKQNYIVCVDLKGYNDLISYFGKENVISIFIDVDYNSRKLRAMARDANFEESEFNRRYKDDLTKLNNIKNIVDYKIKNYNLEVCIKSINNIINKKIKIGD